MYPGLVEPLLIVLMICVAVVAFLVIGRPVLRRLAARQLSRRPAEAFIVIAGALLGTTMIVASLVVGDSLDRSVRQTAYDVLGPIDETVRISSVDIAEQALARLDGLRNQPDVDGTLVARQDLAAATHGSGSARVAAPRVVVTELDFGQAARFGGIGQSGLEVPDPGPRRVVVNSNLADALGVAVGDRVTFHLYSKPHAFTVSRIVPSTGVAGSGIGAAVNRDAFFTPGVLTSAAAGSDAQPSTVVFVSNRGGVESGADLTTSVVRTIHTSLGDLASKGAVVAQPKKEVLDAAARTGDQLGSLFLFIASFSIIAGVMLLVNVFVMLADERRGQLGMLRAIGMRRRRLTGEFALEGAAYGAVAAVLGVGLGVLIARAVVVIAVTILNGFERGDNKLAIVFATRWESLFNGVAAGFIIAFLAVVLTSIRIARGNIIAAIRDLPPNTGGRPRRRLTLVSAVATLLLTVAAVPVLAASNGVGTYLLPALAVVAAIPLLRLVLSQRTAITGVAGAVLLWGLTAHLVRPHMYDDATSAPYVVMGTMLSFAAVVLITLHQRLLLRPARPIVDRPGETGLLARLAVTYPTARPFRTGATLGMYCIVVLVIVLLAQISAVIHAGLGSAVSDASAGWTMRADFNPNTPLPDVARVVTHGGDRRSRRVGHSDNGCRIRHGPARPPARPVADPRDRLPRPVGGEGADPAGPAAAAGKRRSSLGAAPARPSLRTRRPVLRFPRWSAGETPCGR